MNTSTAQHDVPQLKGTDIMSATAVRDVTAEQAVRLKVTKSQASIFQKIEALPSFNIEDGHATLDRDTISHILAVLEQDIQGLSNPEKRNVAGFYNAAEAALEKMTSEEPPKPVKKAKSEPKPGLGDKVTHRGNEYYALPLGGLWTGAESTPNDVAPIVWQGGGAQHVRGLTVKSAQRVLKVCRDQLATGEEAKPILDGARRVVRKTLNVLNVMANDNVDGATDVVEGHIEAVKSAREAAKAAKS